MGFLQEIPFGSEKMKEAFLRSHAAEVSALTKRTAVRAKQVPVLILL